MKLDLAEHLEQLARHVLREGIEYQPLNADQFQHAVRLLYNASQEPDARRRTESYADALRLFSKALSTGRANPVDAAHSPIDPPRYNPPPRTAIDEGMRPLAVQCPQCRSPQLVAMGAGVPLPVACRNCGYQGNLS